MPASKNDKNFARKLYQQGQDSAVIAEECSVSVRTAQRWIKSFEKEKVIVIGQENKAEPEAQTVEVLPALEATSKTSNGQSVELTLTARTATRLLNLSELAIGAVEDILSSGDSSPMSKLRAAQIVGKWVGFEREQASVIATVSLKAGVSASLDHSESDEIRFTPHMVIYKRDSERREAEEAERVAERERRIAEEKRQRVEREIRLKLDNEMEELAELLSEDQNYAPVYKVSSFDADLFFNYLTDYADSKTFQKIAQGMLSLGIIQQPLYDGIIDEYSWHLSPEKSADDASEIEDEPPEESLHKPMSNNELDVEARRIVEELLHEESMKDNSWEPEPNNESETKTPLWDSKTREIARTYKELGDIESILDDKNFNARRFLELLAEYQDMSTAVEAGKHMVNNKIIKLSEFISFLNSGN